MATDLDATFSEQYMNINLKLKKRFMRKPNVAEATNEFLALAIQCEHSEQPSLAAHCYVGAAKCEGSVGNQLAEAEHYLTAARQFMKAEKKLRSMKFYSPDRENLEAAISCFLQAQSKYPEGSLLRVSMLMEVSNELVSMGHKVEALAYYEQAMETVTESAMKLTCLRHKLDLQVECEKYTQALETANAIADSDNKMPEVLLADLQITRVLLTLLVKPSKENQPASLTKLFNDLMNSDSASDLLPLNPELLLKLQSLVTCHELGDGVALGVTAHGARRLLSATHRRVLDALRRRDTDEMMPHV